MGVALYMLVRDLPGQGRDHQPTGDRPVRPVLRRVGGVIGLAIGVLVQHANDAPPGERAAARTPSRPLGENVIVGDAGALLAVGALAWITAVIAAAVAVRRNGAPVLATVLLGLSAVVVSHPPPIGPIGLACSRRLPVSRQPTRSPRSTR